MKYTEVPCRFFFLLGNNPIPWKLSLNLVAYMVWAHNLVDQHIRNHRAVAHACEPKSQNNIFLFLLLFFHPELFLRRVTWQSKKRIRLSSHSDFCVRGWSTLERNDRKEGSFSHTKIASSQAGDAAQLVECLACIGPWVHPQHQENKCTRHANASNLSAWEEEAEGLGVQGQPELNKVH